jgi:hypothetical protein
MKSVMAAKNNRFPIYRAIFKKIYLLWPSLESRECWKRLRRVPNAPDKPTNGRKAIARL